MPIISLYHKATLFQPEEADRIVKEANADPEDDWTYVVKHDPEGVGLSLIEVYDECGNYVGEL